MTREDIARIIKESRLSAGLTQMQVAEAIGRPQTTIASWESGKSQPDANTLFELFRVLGRSVDEAFGFKPRNLDSLEQEAAIKAAESALKRRLGLSYDALNLDGKNKVVSLAEDLSEMPKYRKMTDEEMRKLYPQDKRMLIGGPDGPEWIPGQE